MEIRQHKPKIMKDLRRAPIEVSPNFDSFYLKNGCCNNGLR